MINFFSSRFVFLFNNTPSSSDVLLLLIFGLIHTFFIPDVVDSPTPLSPTSSHLLLTTFCSHLLFTPSLHTRYAAIASLAHAHEEQCAQLLQREEADADSSIVVLETQ